MFTKLRHADEYLRLLLSEITNIRSVMVLCSTAADRLLTIACITGRCVVGIRSAAVSACNAVFRLFFTCFALSVLIITLRYVRVVV